MDRVIFQRSYSLKDIDGVVKDFWDVASRHNVIAFSGEMGAGKTTFIHHLCDYLQVLDTVTSPTFALINEYHFNDGRDRTIYHLDWYRLRDTVEAINAGMEDCILQAQKGSAYCFIEWPEKAVDLLQLVHLRVNIVSTGPSERELSTSVIDK